MAIAFEVLPGDHYLSNINGLVRWSHDSGRRLYGLDFADDEVIKKFGTRQCAIAHVDGTVVGYLGYFLDEKRLSSHGTWVHPLFRKLGVGVALWACALEHHDVAWVSVTVVTDRGKTLIDTLKGEYPAIGWDVHESHDDETRALRNLKGRAA